MFFKCLCFVVHRMQSGLDQGSEDATRAGQKTRNPKPEPGIPESEPEIPETRILFGNFG
jgi:hypothetical protein